MCINEHPCGAEATLRHTAFMDIAEATLSNIGVAIDQLRSTASALYGGTRRATEANNAELLRFFSEATVALGEVESALRIEAEKFAKTFGVTLDPKVRHCE